MVAVTAPEQPETDGLVVVVVAQTEIRDELVARARAGKEPQAAMREQMDRHIEERAAAVNQRSERTETHLPERAAMATHSMALHMRAAEAAEQWDRMRSRLVERVEVGRVDG